MSLVQLAASSRALIRHPSPQPKTPEVFVIGIRLMVRKLYQDYIETQG